MKSGNFQMIDPRKTIESNEHQTRKPYSISLAVPTDSWKILRFPVPTTGQRHTPRHRQQPTTAKTTTTVASTDQWKSPKHVWIVQRLISFDFKLWPSQAPGSAKQWIKIFNVHFQSQTSGPLTPFGRWVALLLPKSEQIRGWVSFLPPQRTGYGGQSGHIMLHLTVTAAITHSRPKISTRTFNQYQFNAPDKNNI